jgi:hypothetical protein
MNNRMLVDAKLARTRRVKIFTTFAMKSTLQFLWIITSPSTHKQNGSYKKYMAPNMRMRFGAYVTQLDAPSRTITSSSGIPLPNVKAL